MLAAWCAGVVFVIPARSNVPGDAPASAGMCSEPGAWLAAALVERASVDTTRAGAMGADTTRTGTPEAPATQPEVASDRSGAAPDSSVLELSERRLVPVRQNGFRGRGPRPKGALWRSAVVPGWGQLYNGRPIKAVLFAAGQVYLGSRAVGEQHEADRLGDEAKSLSDPGVADQRWRAHNRALNRRDDFIWWSVLAAIFSMAEAYVDAALMGFGDEFEGVREVGASGAAARLGLTFSFD